MIYVSKNPVTADSVRIKIKRALGDNSVALVQIIRTSIENIYLYLMNLRMLSKRKSMSMIRLI